MGEWVYYSLFFRFDALLFGAFLALLLEHWRRTSVPSWASQLFYALATVSFVTAGACLFTIRPFLGREIRNSPLILSIALPAFYVGIASLIGLLSLRSGGKWWCARILRTRVLQYLGTISYTMYLVHILAAVIILQLCRVLHRPETSPLIQAMLSLVLTVVLARLSWVYLEKPLLRWKDRRFPSTPRLPRPVASAAASNPPQGNPLPSYAPTGPAAASSAMI